MVRAALQVLALGFVLTGCASRLPCGPYAPSVEPVGLAGRCAVPPCELVRLRPSEGWAERAPMSCFCRTRAKKKSALLATAGVVGTAVYGLSVWDYGSSAFHFANEGWFSEYTEFGGADKVGHFVTAYFGTALVSAIHRRWGFSRREAALRGALTSMLWMTGIEVGDALAEKYGFSYRDLIADFLGCLAGYLHETSPTFQRVVDFRWEYWPTEGGLDGTFDPSGDYSGSSYLVALNVGAMASRRPTHWDLLDVQLGYQTRGYAEVDPDPERWVYVGLGLNLANLLRRVGFRYAAFFDYFQAPFISVRLGYELNDGEAGLLYAP